MSLKITSSRQLMTAPKGQKGDKGDDGRSVTLKGKIFAHVASIPTDYDKVDAPVYAVDEPFCLYYWKESLESFQQTVPDIGDGYVVDNPFDPNNGKLFSSNGSAWLGPYDFKGDKGEQGNDGKDGNDAWLYELKLTKAWARWEYTGIEWRLKCFISGEAWYHEGTRLVPAKEGRYYESDSVKVYISYDNGKGIHNVAIADDGTWSDYEYMADDVYGESRVGYPSCIIVQLRGRNSDDQMVVIDTKAIPIVWDGRPGNNGQNGDVGPMGLPAGVYTQGGIYTRTPQVCPIVEHNNEYWYPAQNGTLTNSEPSADNAAWKKAENFEVMFVKVLFAQFAKMGEAIFHGNFMLSQRGIVDGEESQDYTKFNPNSPDEDGRSDMFAPNLYLNFLTGAARLAGGKAKFNPDGSGSLAGGNLTWDEDGLIAKGTIFANGGEFSGYVKTEFKTINESDAEFLYEENLYPSRRVYRLKNDFNIICEGFVISLPAESSMIGTRATLVGGMGTRSGVDTIIIRCVNGIMGYPCDDSEKKYDLPTELCGEGGIVELLCVKSQFDIVRWCITSINLRYKRVTGNISYYAGTTNE